MPEASFRETLVTSAAELGYGPESFRPLNDAEATQVAINIERAFGDVANGAMEEWWRSRLPCLFPNSARRFNGGGWRHLKAIAPDPTALVWLLAENWMADRPPFIAFESSVDVVQDVLGNTHAFEYIVCGRRLDWLFAENHHDCVTVAGTIAVERLKQILDDQLNV